MVFTNMIERLKFFVIQDFLDIALHPDLESKVEHVPISQSYVSYSAMSSVDDHSSS